ncbi:hypothetical protein V2J09_003313 [Rumex salicifolius]
MAVNLKRTRLPASYSSLSIHKFLKSQKNLPNFPLKLWKDIDYASSESSPINGCETLELNHQILRKLDSSACLNQFNQAHAQFVVLGLFQHPLAASRAVKKLCNLPGTLSRAVSLFQRLEQPDAFICNSIIRGYVNVGDSQRALMFYYESMMGSFIAPNHFTFPLLVKVCAGIGSAMEGEKAHCRAVKLGFELDLFVRNSLIHMYSDLVSFNCMIDGYSRTENVLSARELFDLMPKRNVVSWNIMLSLHVRCKDYTKCMELFEQMSSSGDIRPNEATCVSVLTACGHLGLLDKGKWIHSYINSDKTIKPDVLLSTSLLTMYAKCGDMESAKDVFDQMPEKSVVSWNSMIMGYGTHGCGEKALEMFVAMEKSGHRPNDATFTCILATCAHTGMLLEGWWHFEVMHRVYKIEPKIEHYGCMVDLFGRAGLVRDSEELIKQMPNKVGSAALWGALLSACSTHKNLGLAELVGRRLIEQDPKDIGAYLVLSNLYAAEGRWDDVENVRELMKINGVCKMAGKSRTQSGDSECRILMEDGGSVHKRNMIYSMLTEMNGYLNLPQQVEQTNF